MIVLANEEFATGLRLAGVKESYAVRDKEHALSLLKGISQNEFIIATEKILQLAPKLNEYPNLIVFPETIKDFSKIDDLKKIIRTAIGSEVEI